MRPHRHMQMLHRLPNLFTKHPPRRERVDKIGMQPQLRSANEQDELRDGMRSMWCVLTVFHDVSPIGFLSSIRLRLYEHQAGLTKKQNS
jgi:hypothetical protein